MLLAACAYPAWRVIDYRSAVLEAKLEDLDWQCCGEGRLDLGENHDLVRYRDLIHRLQPKSLVASGCKDKSLDALAGLTSLQSLCLTDCHDLQNIEAIKSLPNLERLYLHHCRALQNVDALKGLTGLRNIDLTECRALHNVDALKSLTELCRLDLTGSTKISVDSFRELRATLKNTISYFPRSRLVEAAVRAGKAGVAARRGVRPGPLCPGWGTLRVAPL